MRYLRNLLLLGCLCAPLAGRAQAEPDTTILLPDLTVTATRTSIKASLAPSRVTRLDRDDVDRLGAETVADLLTRKSAVFMRRWGSTGAATMTLRGAGAGQTLVLLDGFRLSSPQLGQLDLSLVPGLMLESVEIMHGAASPLYGTDAMGGVVNLRTPDAGTPRLIRADVGLGPWGGFDSGFLLSRRVNHISTLFAVDYSRSDGDYSYRNPTLQDAPRRRRTNADFERLSLHGSMGFRAGKHTLRLSGLGNTAQRGLPGLAVSESADERQWDNQVRFWGTDQIALGSTDLKLGAFLERGSLRYVYPGNNLDETGRTLVTGLETEWRAALGRRWTFGTGLTAGYGSATHPSLLNTASERTGAAFLHAEATYGMLRLYPAVRMDFVVTPNGPVYTPVSPRIGINVHPARSAFSFKASSGRSFRLPTFNERFWYPGGDPGLRPERGWSADAGIMWERKGIRAEWSGYVSRLVDQIIWVPTSATFYSAANVTAVAGRGMEFSMEVKRNPVRFDVVYSFTDARDRSDPASGSWNEQLRYIPREQLKSGLSLHSGPVDLGIDARYVGRRYMTPGLADYLEPFIVLDARAGIGGHFGGYHASLSVVVENLTDRTYAVLAHYPMPPRHARLRLLIQSKQIF